MLLTGTSIRKIADPEPWERHRDTRLNLRKMIPVTMNNIPLLRTTACAESPSRQSGSASFSGISGDLSEALLQCYSSSSEPVRQPLGRNQLCPHTLCFFTIPIRE